MNAAMTPALAAWIVVAFLVVIAGICWACYELSQAPAPEGSRRRPEERH